MLPCREARSTACPPRLCRDLGDARTRAFSSESDIQQGCSDAGAGCGFRRDRAGVMGASCASCPLSVPRTSTVPCARVPCPTQGLGSAGGCRRVRTVRRPQSMLQMSEPSLPTVPEEEECAPWRGRIYQPGLCCGSLWPTGELLALPSRAWRNSRPLRSVLGVSTVAQRVMNPTGIHEDAGSIPGLTQWIKDLVLLGHRAAWIQCGRGCGVGRQLPLRFNP